MSSSDSILRVPVAITSDSGNIYPSYNRFSIPLPRGSVKGEAPILLRGSDGSIFPSQSWSLGTWPDGSTRVLHVIAPLARGNYVAEIGGDEARPSAEVELTIQSTPKGIVSVQNGASSFEFSADSLITQAVIEGAALLDRSSLQLIVVSEKGERFALEIENTPKVVRSGPLYTVVEQWVRTTSKDGKRHLRFRFQFEFFAGIPGLTCNLMLVNDCPGFDYQDFRSIELLFRLAQSHHAQHTVFQNSYGFEYISNRFFETSNMLDIRADASQYPPYVSNYQAMEDDNVYPHYLRPPPSVVGSAIFLREDQRVLQIEMQDFLNLRPKGIRLDHGEASFAIWPEWEKSLHLQQGRRRQMRFGLFMGHHEVPKNYAEAEASSALLLNPFRAQLPGESYAHADFYDLSRTLDFRPDRYPRFEGWLKMLPQLRTQADFFNLGDTPDDGYGSTYIPVGYRGRKDHCAPHSTFYLSPNYPGRAVCHDHLEDYAPIWVNNEYDVLFCLGTEYLRSSNLYLFQMLRWFSRHTIEVDFLCYSDHPVHHHAQPAHSENHTTASAYPSHFWTQGLAQYYFLSGDEDALMTVRQLAEKTIWYFDHPIFGALHTGINREMGWSVLTLVSAYEATGDPVFDLYARKLIDLVIGAPLPEDVPDFNFGLTSFFLGCRAYIESHHNEACAEPVLEWYLKYLDLAILCSTAPPQGKRILEQKLKLSYDYTFDSLGSGKNQPRPGILPGFVALDCLAYAFEKTGKKDYLKAGIRTLLAFTDGNPGYSGNSFRNPIPQGKPFAWIYRSWITYLGALDKAKWLETFDYQIPKLPND